MKNIAKRIIPLVFIIIFMFSGCDFAFLPADTDISDSPVFIIDAGHGGEDGGAVSSDGKTVEKDLNLEISFRMRDILQLFGFKTEMVRTADISICDEGLSSLRERKVSDIHKRLKMLEAHDNSILISIHQNKFGESKYSGTQVFYSANNPQSELLAEEIQSAVRNILQNSNTRQIKKSGSSIYVLYNATKPAVMVECGFLSNEAETKLLKDSTYQSQLVFSIFSGIFNYLNNKESDQALS